MTESSFETAVYKAHFFTYRLDVSVDFKYTNEYTRLDSTRGYEGSTPTACVKWRYWMITLPCECSRMDTPTQSFPLVQSQEEKENIIALLY